MIWEQSVQFQRVYGKQVEILRNFPTEKVHENTDADAAHNEIKSYVPAPWRNMPKNEHKNENENDTGNPKIVLDNNIKKLISDLRETLPADMYLTESDLQITALKEQSLATREYPFCYLTMILLVPKGNPLFIKSVRNTLEQKHRLGIIDPSINGMGIAAWDIVTKINETLTTTEKKPKNKITEKNENENIKIYDTIKDLLEALEQNQIDAALTWDACAIKTKDFAEIVHIGKNANKNNSQNANNSNNSQKNETNKTQNNNETQNTLEEHRLIRVSIVSLTIANKESHCRRFADFLISAEGQRILRRHGFTPTGK
jgi:ABC-type molybdate transport system substrate-binding protein